MFLKTNVNRNSLFFNSNLRNICCKYFSTCSVLQRKNENFSYSTVEEIINKMVEKDFRDIKILPQEFHVYSDILITLEKPREPEDYECCGKGCSPCCWDVYDSKVRKYEETLKFIYEKVNDEN